VLASLLVRLLGADPDELFEDIAHLGVVDAVGGEINVGKSFDDFIEQILFRHPGDLLIESKPLHDLADILGKGVDVAVQVRRELIRIIEQLRHIQLRQIVKGTARNL
jgi:hypothetical protein